ncbi:MAG: redoxin domain-containing protein [Gemmatimonadetes bacterium]|nr:redoxin domain-containing protein [Gemmatimonadota bacterium]
MRFDPVTAVQHWETLLENTGYENRGAAFLYSCGPLLKVVDSVRVHTQIDSAVKWVPRSSVYKVIARIMNGQEVPSSYGDVKLYPSTALKYAKKAIASADDIPLPHRNHALCDYHRVLGHSYLAAEQLNEAEIAFQQALSIFGELPEHHTLVKNNWDGGVLKDLGMVKTLKRDYDGALQLYSDALVKNPYDTDLWNMLQRVYTLRHGTDEGYRAFAMHLEQRLPPKNKADTRSIIGRDFPDFSLQTIKGETINFADLKGQVVVVNFWGSWCGPCIPELSMLEKIHSEYSDAPVKVIAIHDMFRRGIFKDYLSTIQKIAEQTNISFPMLYDTEEVNIAGRSDIRHTPTTLIINKEGKIQYEEMGYVETRFLPQVKAIIEKLIAG